MNKYIEDYIKEADWRIKENSNTVFSIGGLKNLLSETVIAKYSLSKLPKKIRRAHEGHLIHLHDLGNNDKVYCVGWSLEDILRQGLTVDVRFPASSPAKHFGTALEHLLNHCFILTNEASGAMAYSSVDIYLAPFIKEDKLSYDEVRQQVQRMVFGLSQKYRSGLQAPFSNITLDLKPLGDMKHKKAIVGGKDLDYTYSDCQPEIDMFNRAFCEIMEKGDSVGKPFAFPIPTYSITKEFDWYGEQAEMLFKMAVASGIPYFSNFVNSDLDPEDIRSMCVTPESKVKVKWVRTGKLEEIEIGKLLEENSLEDFLLLTSNGYRAVERKIIADTKEIIEITLESGKTLKVTPDHPSLAYGKSGLEVIKSEDLKIGMEFSTKRSISGVNNPNSSKDTHRMKFLNRSERIVSLERKEYVGKVYDVEIKEEEGRYSVHNFFVNDILTHNCCRLRLDKRELINNGGGLFGAGEKTGSMGVVTLNLPRLAYMSENPKDEKVIALLEDFGVKLNKSLDEAKDSKERLFILIDFTMDLGKEFLVLKRTDVEENLKKGLYPYTTVYLEDYSDHFNTLGVVGMNEALLNLGYDKGILNPEGKILAENILDRMLNNLADYQEEYGAFYNKNDRDKGLLFNLEATPAEGAGYKLAKYDHEYFEGRCITANGLVDSEPYYTNSTWIPQDDLINEDIFDILDHQDSLQSKYTSGTVQHIYTTGKLTWEKGRDIIKKACENYTMPYFSLSPTITVCPIHGRLDKEYEFCPFDHTEEELAYIKKMGGMLVPTAPEESF